MKEAKFTKGPWQVVDDYDKYEPYTPDTPQIYIWDGDEQASCPICDMGQMGDFNYAKALANAQLIAAAPLLYEALEDMISIVSYLNEFEPEYTDRLLKAKTALSSAVGE